MGKGMSRGGQARGDGYPNANDASSSKVSSASSASTRKIIERGGMNGIRTASKMFIRMDTSGNGILSREELVDGLSQFGIEGLS